MGFERDEVPSRVQGRALPGQGQRPCVPRAKPENPRASFAEGERAQPSRQRKEKSRRLQFLIKEKQPVAF